MHGYDIGKYAMLLAVDNGLGFGTTYPDRVYTDAPDRGQGYVSDYRSTMTSLLTLYYEHLAEWSERFLGLEFSGQVGYNLPVDMLEVIPAVGAPEDESLGFGSSIGYGYEYISPSNFRLPLSVVKKGVLAPDGPEYKLLILRSTELLTTDGVDKLVHYAQQGLPVLISGGIPNQIASSKGLSAAKSNLKSITSLPNVHMVPAGRLASTVVSIGIQPLTKVSANQTWYTYWRQISKDKEAYVFIYNDGNSSSTGSISFANTKLPFFLHAWTGEQTPVFQYTVNRDHTTIPLTLAPRQSIIVAFLGADSERKRPLYVTSGPSAVLGYSHSKSNDMIVKVPFLKNDLQISTSNGEQHQISARDTPEPFILHDWTLVAEKWGPPANFDDSSTSSSKTNTTYKLPSLLSWPLIPGLQNTSGVGYYSNSFSWNDTSVGAFIDFGRVVHTLRVSINGHRLPPLDVTSARADISAFLRNGRNEVAATISTTLINGLIPYWDKLMTSGMGPLNGSLTSLNLQVEAGLVGQVVVTPYEEVLIGV
ncbi:hypothetical protein DL98DRAFT_610481 [Cadophora sp. DSE1049]|nr:hypothetical protein DL98DRAFT_610481 [Cadophora sp. DSE1049]